jgi:hypothetical protein
MGAPTYVELNVISRKASGNVTANRVVVQHSVEGEVIASSAITQPAFGVALNTASAGQAVSIETGRTIVKLTAGASIALGAQVMPQAAGSGKVIPSAGGTAVDCGTALQAAGGDGEIISVLFNPMGKSPANT